MAHREHVTRGTAYLAAIIAVAALLAGGCSEAGPTPTEFRGRVIDQDTGKPIAGAIVVGKYMGSRGFEGASSCNRVESAVSDSEGWFTLPLDPRDGGPLMEAYHRGYRWGRSPRWAEQAVDGNLAHWQIQVVEWNADNSRAKLLRYEPTIYSSQARAFEASRQEIDVYLKPFTGSREQRLDELHRVSNAGSCNASQRTTAGPVPFFEAIYAEQVALGDDSRSLELTRESIASAESNLARAKASK